METKKLPIVFKKDIRLADVLEDPKLKKRLKEWDDWEKESAKTPWVLGEPLSVTEQNKREALLKRLFGDLKKIAEQIAKLAHK